MIKDCVPLIAKTVFFFITPPGAVHAPHHTKPEDRERYTAAKYAEGWDKIREQRLAKNKTTWRDPPNARS